MEFLNLARTGSGSCAPFDGHSEDNSPIRSRPAPRCPPVCPPLWCSDSYLRDYRYRN